jgi:hypothetical protein
MEQPAMVLVAGCFCDRARKHENRAAPLANIPLNGNRPSGENEQKNSFF